MSTTSARRVLASVLVACCLLSAGGCLTLGPTAATQPTNSTVFESYAVDESWSSGRASVTVTLTENATTERGVRTVNVISESGNGFWSGPVDGGETRVTVAVPTHQNATIVAVNASGSVVDTQPIRVDGRRVP